MDRMTFSKWLRVQDTQSRDMKGEYNYFLPSRDEVQDEGRLEGKLQQIEFFFYEMVSLLWLIRRINTNIGLADLLGRYIGKVNSVPEINYPFSMKVRWVQGKNWKMSPRY